MSETGLEVGEIYTRTVDRISRSGNAIIEEDGVVNLGPLREEAVGKEVTFLIWRHDSGLCIEPKSYWLDEYVSSAFAVTPPYPDEKPKIVQRVKKAPIEIKEIKAKIPTKQRSNGSDGTSKSSKTAPDNQYETKVNKPEYEGQKNQASNPYGKQTTGDNKNDLLNGHQ
jgi:hypothetical protein